IEIALYKHSAETSFLAALEKDDLDERAAALIQACADDPALRRCAAKLLTISMEAATIEMQPAQATRLPAACAQPATDTQGEEPAEVGDAHDFPYFAPARKPGCLCQLDHYDVVQVVGHGARGIVFKAFDDALQRVVAIKIMAPPLAASPV